MPSATRTAASRWSLFSDFVARLRWPLPALAAWAAAWATWLLARAAALPPAFAFAAAVVTGALVSLAVAGRLRRLIVAGGFPLSALALGGTAGLPPWLWLLLLLPLLLAYPLRAWSDAPFFPTPADALRGLSAAVGTPQCVLDAGCGLGQGLAALRGLWPQAQLHGLEWSLPLAGLAALRCPYARVRRGDMWSASWSDYDLVYLFQRPESMARAFAKAVREMPSGGWLVSLEFAVPDQPAAACLQGPGRRSVWVYRLAAAPAHSTGSAACR